MTLSYQDDWLTIYGGDCRTVLAELPTESVHCVVTSPPYWGLRDYGVTDQLGLEPTPEQYVENMVAVFREVRRVLRSDGTVWLNLGDSYAANMPAGVGRKAGVGPDPSRPIHNVIDDEIKPARMVPAGLKPKDLVGIPWRVAFALQADGWYLRSDIIWSKPNPMPESVTDRPTKSHEYLFLLAKSPRYYFDADAVRQEQSDLTFARGHVAATAAGVGNGTKAGLARGIEPNPAGRNIRTVWTIATQPYPGAHFAVFPEKLIEPCILAGTSERGVCPECGAPWVRVVERSGTMDRSAFVHRKDNNDPTARQMTGGKPATVEVSNGQEWARWKAANPDVTTGWRPACLTTCNYAEADGQSPVPATVLDPFGGSGTTARVANRLSRRAVLIDLNPEYLKQQMDRNRDLPLGLGA